jgi:hypothetical protein
MERLNALFVLFTIFFPFKQEACRFLVQVCIHHFLQWITPFVFDGCSKDVSHLYNFYDHDSVFFRVLKLLYCLLVISFGGFLITKCMNGYNTAPTRREVKFLSDWMSHLKIFLPSPACYMF